MNHLLHPELIQAVPVIGGATCHALERRINETLVDDPAHSPDISVVIRARNEEAKLERLMQDISQQVTGGKVEIIVVDNESTDDTRDVAQKYGARVVTIPKGEFTYPRSMNLGMEAASHDTVFMTVAHAQLSSAYTLHAGARHFKHGSKVGGVFAMTLPTVEASLTDRWLAAGGAVLFMFRQAHAIKRIRIAVLGAIGATISKPVWKELGGFDEAYESGGEDTALARAMLATGYEVIDDPALAVHHAHGLGFRATMKDIRHYAKTVKGPQKFDRVVHGRRAARFGDQAK